MIAKLWGLVDDADSDSVILNVSGVGYRVFTSGRTLGGLPARGEMVELYIETVVREDAITLFGFGSTSEQDMFTLLTSVQGVGAKVGLAILSIYEPDQLQNIIAAQDKASIARANGVGPKLAARITNELKDKVGGLVFTPKGVAGTPEAKSGVSAAPSHVEEAISALVNLGYRPVDAHQAAARASLDAGGDVAVETLITSALKELASV